MLDEEMDDIIREAASKHHPAYNDKAWEKMHQKLDVHLPQKDDRRRYIYWMFLLLLLGGSTVTGWLYYSNRASENNTLTTVPSNEKQQVATIPSSATVNTITDIQNTADDPDKAKPGTATTGSNTSKNGTGQNSDQPQLATGIDRNTTTGDNQTRQHPVGKKQAVSNTVTRDKTNTSLLRTQNRKGAFRSSAVTPSVKTDSDNDLSVVDNDEVLAAPSTRRRSSQKAKTKMRLTAAKPSQDISTASKPVKQDEPIDGDDVKGTTLEMKALTKTTITAPAADVSNTPAVDTPAEEEKKNEAPVAKEEKKQKDTVQEKNTAKQKPDDNKKKRRFANNFGITVSAGTDLSFIDLNKLGKATFIYGAGLSYDISKRFTVQAGFYASKKIYNASPDQYHGGSVYPYLDNIDAICKVYEIPLSVTYQFAQKKRHNWFGGAGISSFIMKQEDYDYVYKTPSGAIYKYRHSYSNENKHYFSVLSLFGGYRYTLGEKLSFAAGPYVKIPLGGVGAGKVKLNSAGVMLTATIKPFAKKK